MEGSTVDKPTRRMLDRVAIRQVLAGHGRGLDRCDLSLLRRAYHPGAQVAYGFFNGPAADFCEIVTEQTRPLPVTLHRTQNMWIKFQDDDDAVAESYVIAYMHVPGDGSGTQSLIGGRYLDRFARRNEGWRIALRTYVLDWNMSLAGTGSADPAFQPIFTAGAKHPDDAAQNEIEAWRADTTGAARGSNAMDDEANMQRALAEALAKNCIHDLIMAKARATDRGDLELMRSLWHPDATVDVGPLPNDAQEYCVVLIDAMAERDKMFHSVANEWIEVDGDSAVAESYVIAFTTVRDGEEPIDELTGGRYLDRFEKRHNEWKFTHRTFVADWQMRQPSTDQTGQGLYESFLPGKRSKEDPVYAHWNTESAR